MPDIFKKYGETKASHIVRNARNLELTFERGEVFVTNLVLVLLATSDRDDIISQTTHNTTKTNIVLAFDMVSKYKQTKSNPRRDDGAQRKKCYENLVFSGCM